MIKTYHYGLIGYWHILIVCQNILRTCIRFHLKNKLSNIALSKANGDFNNALVETKSIISIDALNLDVLDLFNDFDDKTNHLIGDGMLVLDLSSKKWGCMFAL